jgi:hypothetical protein
MESPFFQIRIPPQANLLNPETLDPVCQRMLLNSRFDPAAHEAFWFPITVEHFDSEMRDFYEELHRTLPSGDYETMLARFQRFHEQRRSALSFLPRKKKRKSFYVVDALSVHVGVATPGVSLLGICPRSIDANFMPVMSRVGTPATDVETVKRSSKVGGGAEAPLAGIFKSSLSTEAQEESRYRQSSAVIVRAFHNHREATWEFGEPWLKSGAETSVQFLCTAHKSLPPNQRFVVCKAIASENRRTVANTAARRITLPS